MHVLANGIAYSIVQINKHSPDMCLMGGKTINNNSFQPSGLVAWLWMSQQPLLQQPQMTQCYPSDYQDIAVCHIKNQ